MANRDVIVIGGSTGAIKPLNAILGMLPGNIDAAVLVVIHVQSGSAGIRTALAANSPLPVLTASEGMAVEHGKVYIAPPDHHLLLIDGIIKLGNGPRENLARPAIDPLLRSAALTAGSRTIGLVLSGMLNDGAAGLASIKRCGGVAMVQAPSTAVAPEMPLAALEATAVDLSGGERDLATAILKFVAEEAGPLIATPPALRLEVAIAAGDATTTGTVEQFAHPVALTCPDCGGVLSEADERHPLRFRCQVGHAYTAKALLAEQQDAVDEAMRVALRIIEERAHLVSRMGQDAECSGRSSIAEDYLKRADEYRAQADVLRVALLDLMQLKGDRPSDVDIAGYEAKAAFGKKLLTE